MSVSKGGDHGRAEPHRRVCVATKKVGFPICGTVGRHPCCVGAPLTARISGCPSAPPLVASTAEILKGQ